MTTTKGILLAGGAGTRLDPMTRIISKQLLPVYDKPMFYYPLSVLMLAGIRDILIITTEQDLPRFSTLTGDGSQWGVTISYAVQPRPEGISQAFVIGREFVGSDRAALILGDNIFDGQGLSGLVQTAALPRDGATVFGYFVDNPSLYGVLEFDSSGNVVGIVEKPIMPKSNYIVTGLYFYDNQVLDIVRDIQPSTRGELEITDVNIEYLRRGRLDVVTLGPGIAWLDTGTHRSLLQASNYVQIIEQRLGLKIACLEEIAFRMGYIGEDTMELAARSAGGEYGRYLQRIIQSAH